MQWCEFDSFWTATLYGELNFLTHFEIEYPANEGRETFLKVSLCTWGLVQYMATVMYNPT